MVGRRTIVGGSRAAVVGERIVAVADVEVVTIAARVVVVQKMEGGRKTRSRGGVVASSLCLLGSL